MSIASIAMSRCISVCFPLFSKTILDGKKNLLLVFGIWVYAIVLVLPTIFKVYGKFGYDRKRGKCDYLEDKENVIGAKLCFLGIAFIVPMILIAVSYYVLWRTAKASSYLKVNS